MDPYFSSPSRSSSSPSPSPSPSDYPQRVPSPSSPTALSPIPPSLSPKSNQADPEVIETVERLLYEEQVACIDVCFSLFLSSFYLFRVILLSNFLLPS